MGKGFVAASCVQKLEKKRIWGMKWGSLDFVFVMWLGVFALVYFLSVYCYGSGLS